MHACAAEFQALDAVGYLDAKSFYRCVPEVTNSSGTPERGQGNCGGFAQPCCNTGDMKTQCGSGLSCNYGAPSPRLHSASWIYHVRGAFIAKRS